MFSFMFELQYDFKLQLFMLKSTKSRSLKLVQHFKVFPAYNATETGSSGLHTIHVFPAGSVC